MEDPRKTKSAEISARLKAEILGGKFDGSRKLPSEHQLMRRFSVARETVRAALRELESGRLLDRKPGCGTFLADRAAAAVAHRFAVIMPDGYYSFYSRIARGIEAASRERGWSVMSVSLGSGNMRERAIKAADFAGMCVREKVGGVFFQPLQFMRDGEKFNRAILRIFDDARIPVVLIDSDISAPPMRSEYDLVGIDNTNAGYVLARHVISRGAKKVWYFSTPLPAPASLKRANGVGVAVWEAGLKWTRENIFFSAPDDSRAIRRLFTGRNRPDAIIAVNDFVAAQLLKTLKAIGIDVPGDVLLAGVNGDEIAEDSTPALTTLVQPCHEIGTTAVELMMRRVGGATPAPCKVLLDTHLVVRDSTAANIKDLNIRKQPNKESMK